MPPVALALPAGQPAPPSGSLGTVDDLESGADVRAGHVRLALSATLGYGPGPKLGRSPASCSASSRGKLVRPRLRGATAAADDAAGAERGWSSRSRLVQKTRSGSIYASSAAWV